MKRRTSLRFLCFLVFLVFPSVLFAAKIGDISTLSWKDQAFRFFTFQDPSVRIALLGSVLLGISCGLLGAFLVVRSKSLFGDTLSHAVLPGIALGFLWNMEKNPINLFIGATIAGVLGVFAVNRIRSTTILKEDSSMGLVLSSFYALGILLLTMIQNIPNAHQAGLDKFLFGQASAISEHDLVLMAIVTLLSIIIIVFFFKEFLTISFDSAFSTAVGIPRRTLESILMTLVAFSIVISLQAVGVVLISAMLIIPPATALLVTNRFQSMILLSVLLGLISAIFGTFFSFTAHNLPTGPFMVVSAALIFVLTLFFAPRKGIIAQWRTHREPSIH